VSATVPVCGSVCSPHGHGWSPLVRGSCARQFNVWRGSTPRLRAMDGFILSRYLSLLQLALTEPTQHIIAILLRKERAHAAESIVEHFPWIVRCLLCIILNLFLNVTERLWFANCIRCVRVGLRVGVS
jgi:hypothetical protein